MIRRLSSLFSRWVGDDPNPEPFMPADAMVEPVVVPALEPDVEPVRMPLAVAQFLAEQNRGRHALPLDAAKDARIFAYETNGRVVLSDRSPPGGAAMTRDAALLLACLREEFEALSDALVDWRMAQFVSPVDSQRRAIADERLADLADRLIFGDDDEPTIHDLRTTLAEQHREADREARV